MNKTAFVFSGQGAQYVGMGKDAYERSFAAHELYEQANAQLPYSLSNLSFNGPADQLNLTLYTQPALLTVSLAFLKVYEEAGGCQADYMAGHSLGEYSALVAAGGLDFTGAIKLVQARGTFMEQAVPHGQGTMAAVMGADCQALQSLCTQISDLGEPVALANVNSPAQIVVSGSTKGVELLKARAKDIRAKRVIPLEVSGPFHSTFMQPAAEQLKAVMEETTFRDPYVPIISNVSARPVNDGTQWAKLLIQQMVSPVQWLDTVLWLIDQGVTTFIEFGPGTVLSRLIKKIAPTMNVFSVNSVEAAIQAANFQ